MKVWIAKLLKQGYIFHKLRKNIFQVFFTMILSSCTNIALVLKHLQEGLSKTEFYGDDVHKLWTHVTFICKFYIFYFFFLNRKFLKKAKAERPQVNKLFALSTCSLTTTIISASFLDPVLPKRF